ncbi:MAG: tyrosine-type recombinase/integrase [Proteobacteria bacterium]|nr:tyrosine-type recombinase/integrase [Pseudomonadota bacterium]
MQEAIMGKQVEKLSDVQIRRWIKAGEPVAKADGDGLTFTLSTGGTAAWVLRYRFGGKPRELTLGRYPDKALTEARDDARKARASIQNGIDVAREKQIAGIERAAARSFRQLATDYMDKVFPALAANTIKQRKQHIEKVILPKLGNIPAREVTTADIVSMVESVGKKSINVAELVFTAVSEILKHGVARHVVTANPCAGISVSAICGRPVPTRPRLMLTEAELRVILPALPSIGQQNALTVKILLTTCVRIGELARAEWTHVDFERGLWFVPDANSKAKTGYTVPLDPAVAGWFAELKTLACGSPFVLPARQLRRKHNHGGETHFEPRALNAMLHKLCSRLEAAENPVRRFTPHDLRSTARSWLTSKTIGASLIVAERCLNHSLGGLLAIYDQHDYLTERRTVLERWTAFILACEAGNYWIPESENVHMLRQEDA